MPQSSSWRRLLALAAWPLLALPFVLVSLSLLFVLAFLAALAALTAVMVIGCLPHL